MPKQSRAVSLFIIRLWKTFFQRLLLDNNIDILRGSIKRRERAELDQFDRISGESILLIHFLVDDS